MYNVNMAGMWGIPVKKEEPKEAKEPDRCDHCIKKIEEGDYYYVGYDSNDIYAETCTHFRCTQWFKHKARLRKGYKS